MPSAGGRKHFKAPQITKKMSFVSSRHFIWISRIIKHRIIDFACELTITEFDMVNITLSYLMSKHHSLMTGNPYMSESNDCHATGCI